MGKNSYIDVVKKAKEKAYADGVWSGMRMGLNLCAIALNHEFEFGETRLTRLERKVQELIDEIIDTNDPYVTQVRVSCALKQIRGDAFELE